jgi:hypothetical protein
VVRCRLVLSHSHRKVKVSLASPIVDLTDAPAGSAFLRAAEIEARNCPTGNTDQLDISDGEPLNTGEAPTGNNDQLEISDGEPLNTGEAQAQEVGLEAPRRGRKRGAATETNSPKKTKRAPNWKPDETLKLIQSRLQLSPERGRAEWEAISVQIPGRTGKQCQQRWDTVVRSYKKIKCHCKDKHFDQVTEEEFRSMKEDWHDWRDNNWYRMIDEYYLRQSSGK